MFKASCCLFWASKKPAMAVADQWTGQGALLSINVRAESPLQKKGGSAAAMC